MIAWTMDLTYVEGAPSPRVGRGLQTSRQRDAVGQKGTGHPGLQKPELPAVGGEIPEFYFSGDDANFALKTMRSISEIRA